MKNLLSSISITLGLITMTHAASFNAPGKDFLLIKGASLQWEAPKAKTGAAMTKPSTALPSLLFTWHSLK